MKIARWDDDIRANITSNETWLYDFEQDVNHTHFSSMMMKEGPDPVMGWAAVYQTNKKYRVHWGEGLDYELMHAFISPTIYGPNDGNIHFVTNFTDVRMSINVTDQTGYQIPNETYTTKTEAEYEMGDNVIYN